MLSRWLPLLILIILLTGVALFYQMRLSDQQTGMSAPDFTLPDLQGQKLTLADLRGEIVFLNFWATWCPPCRREMPSMEGLYRKFRERGFEMLAVSEDVKGKAIVQPFVEEMHLSFPVLLDPQGTLPPRYGVTGYPETFVIDRSGHIVQHIVGPHDWGTQESYQYFDRLLQQESGKQSTTGANAKVNFADRLTAAPIQLESVI